MPPPQSHQLGRSSLESPPGQRGPPIRSSPRPNPGPRGPQHRAVARGPAEESAFRRAFALISADVLDQVIGAWLHTMATQAGGRLVIAVDGKAVRGARNREEKAPHLVAALAHGIGAVLGRVAVDAKSNEIPAVRELLKAFTDLAGAIITAGALHTQSDTAQAITGRHADDVMTVKAGMPTLYKQLKKLPWTAIPATSAVSTDHGRRARRTIKAVLVPAWIEFAGAAQVRRSAARSRRKARRPSRSCTSLPATATPIPPPWRPGSAATGR